MIEKLTLDELNQARRYLVLHKAALKLYEKLGAETYSDGGSVARHKPAVDKMIAEIDSELARRKEESDHVSQS